MKEQWIVVCTETHAAFGTFDSEREAEIEAISMSVAGLDGRGCEFVPVPFTVTHKPKGAEREHPGQYL